MRPHTTPAIHVEKKALPVTSSAPNRNDASLTHRTAMMMKASAPATATGVAIANGTEDGLIDPSVTTIRPIAAIVTNVISQMNEYDRSQLSLREPSTRQSSTGTLMNRSASPTEARIGGSGVTNPIRAAQ